MIRTVGPLYLKMINGTKTILKNMKHYFPEFADRTEFDFVGFGWFLGWNDGCGSASTAEYYPLPLLLAFCCTSFTACNSLLLLPPSACSCR